MLHLHREPDVPPFPPKLSDIRIEPPMVFVAPVWEYRQMARDSGQGTPGIDELNSLGADGWELVAVVPEGVRLQYYFKRLVR
jgi:hypothetical protein